MNAAILLLAQRAELVRTDLARADAERIAAAEYHAKVTREADALAAELTQLDDALASLSAAEHAAAITAILDGVVPQVVTL